MKLTLDFDNNTVETEHGTILIPDLSANKTAILHAIGLEEISGEELRADIRKMLDEMGLEDIGV